VLVIALFLVATSLHVAWLKKPAPRRHADLVAAGLVLACGEISIALAPGSFGAGDLLGQGLRVLGALFLVRALLDEMSAARSNASTAPQRDGVPAGHGPLPTVLAEIDRTTRILHLQANPADLLGGAAGSLRGRRLEEVLPDAAAASCRRALEHADRSGVPQQFSVELALPDGPEWIEMSIARRPSSEGQDPTFTLLARSRAQRLDSVPEAEAASPSRLNAALLELEKQSATKREDELIASAAAMAEQLTRSRFSRILVVEPDGRLSLHPQGVSDQADAPAAIDLETAGAWADGLRKRRPVLVDLADPAPEADSDLDFDRLSRWIGVPAIEEDRGRLLIVVGDRTTPYSDRDVLAIQVLANTTWAAIKRKRQERQLRLLSFGVDQSPNPILITDAHSRIQYVNAAFQKVTGYSLDDVLGKNPSILSAGQTPASTYREMWQTLATGRPWQGELINRRKNGHRFLEQALIYPVRDDRGTVTHYLAHIRDLTERREIESRVDRLTRFDQLTGLPNQTAVEEALAKLLAVPEAQVSVLWINLDNFKLVNESLGREIGNLFLLETANRVRAKLTADAILARQSGDNFVVVLPRSCQDRAALEAARLMAAIHEPTPFDQEEVAVTASIGAALSPNDAQDAERLLRFAEAAMYAAKREGRNTVRFYSSQLQSGSERTLKLISGIAPALQRGEMRMVYQPQMRLNDGRLIGAEALIRWQHPELGTIPPSEFIPLAEQGGLVKLIDAWVIDTVVRQLQQWRAAGIDLPVVAINLSASQLGQPDLVDRLRTATESAGVLPEQLELEVTEAAAMKDPEQAGETIRALRTHGFRLSIDDFGSGYSSMNYLKRFTVQCLKIDAAFIQELEESKNDRAIVRAIIQMAHSLGMQTLAEGVERATQVDFLREQGCDAIQGYWFARPLEVEAFETFCRSHLRPD
jgi:diguanylate cyclase (GGDEF)-like protein/PAS domain S-box-containing protein